MRERVNSRPTVFRHHRRSCAEVLRKMTEFLRLCSAIDRLRRGLRPLRALPCYNPNASPFEGP